MTLCSISRNLNRRHPGEMLCTSAIRTGSRWAFVLDVILYYTYDGPDHCLRMWAFEDCTGWGVPDPLAGLRRAGL